jgi:hypothetical protein
LIIKLKDSILQFNIAGIVDGDFVGQQDAAAAITKGKFTGLQWGIYTSAGDGEWVQFGVINTAKKMNGLHLDFINYTVNMKGLQIGLVNIIKSNVK